MAGSQKPAQVTIPFFGTGFYTYRSQLFAPFRSVGINIVSYHDPAIDGQDMEYTDLMEVQRRPGYAKFCSVQLNAGEIINQFYSARALNGNVLSFFDSNQRLATFTSNSITTIFNKQTTAQGFIAQVGNVTFFTDGVDDIKNDPIYGQTINGIASPLAQPTFTGVNNGFWYPGTTYASGSVLYDYNGNIELASQAGSGVSGTQFPVWATLAGSITNDGTIDWTNLGVIGTWAPYFQFTVPTVILDTNGNLQMLNAIAPVPVWNSVTSYTVGETVFYANRYHTVVAANSNVPPLDGGVDWISANNPQTSGATAPTWNTTVGGFTVDGTNPNPGAISGSWLQWKNIGQGVVTAYSGYSYVQCIRTIDGHLSTASPQSVNTGPIIQGPLSGPSVITQFLINSNIVTFVTNNNFSVGQDVYVQGMLNATYFNNLIFTIAKVRSAALFTITNVALTSNVVTLTCTNTLVAGDVVNLSGLTLLAPFLNGQTLIVSTASGSSFTAAFTHANVSTGAETGTVSLPGQVTAPFTHANVASTLDSGVVSPVVAQLQGFGTGDARCTYSAPITAVSLISDTVTVTADNIFVPGETVTCTGLTGASFLNGFPLLIESTTPTQFTAFFAGADYKTQYSASPTVGNNKVTLGGQAWVNPSNVTSNSSFATCTFINGGPSISKILQAQTFNFAIPANVTPTGIVVTFNGAASGDTQTIMGLINAFNFSSKVLTPELPVSATSLSVGSPTDTWGMTLSPQLINMTTFGVLFELQVATNAAIVAQINDVQMTVYATTADGGTATFNSIEIYRTGDGGGIWYLDNAVTNPGPSSQWSFVDIAPDLSLENQFVAPIGHLNDPPPGQPGSVTPANGIQVGGTMQVYWQGRLWKAVGSSLYFDAGSDCLNGIPEQSWPPANKFNWAGPITGLVATNEGLLVYLADRVGLVLGGPQTLTFYQYDLLTNFGVTSPNCLHQDAQTIYALTTQGQLWTMNGANRTEEGHYVADYIQNTFAPATSYLTMHRNGLDSGLFLSNGVDTALRYGTNIGAWSLPAKPVGGIGALRSVETSTGIYTLCAAPATAAGFILGRNLNTWQDNGNNYTNCFTTIGSITLSDLGEPLYPVQHIVGYFAAVGSKPVVDILPNEITANSGIGFINLPDTSPEPPIGQTNPSSTIKQYRYRVNMMNSSLASQLMHHLQIRITFPPENVPNSIIKLAVKPDQD